MNNWILLVIASIFFSSFARILQKKIYQNSPLSSELAATIFQLLTGLIIFVFAVINGFSLEGIEQVVPNLIAMTLLYVGMNYFLFKSFKQSEASTVTIIFSSNVAWVLIASAVFLGEVVTASKLIGIALIFTATVLITLDSGKFKIDKKLVYPLIAALLIALAFVNDVYVSTRMDLLSFLTIAFIFPGIGSILLLLPGKKYLALTKLKGQDYIKNSLLALCYAVSAISVYQAYALGAEASILSPLTQLSIFVTVILSYFILNEKNDFKFKIAVSVIAVVGAVILTVG